MKTIRITRAFLEQAAAAKAARPCAARVSRRRTYADVAYREWSDHYDIYALSGQWICSFTDSSLPGLPRFENIHTRQGVRLILPN